MFHGAILQPNVVRSQQLIVVSNRRSITTMSSKEKKEFATRMNEVADDLGIPEKGKNRQKTLGIKFSVSQEAARKWLAGEGFPSTEKSIEIAKVAGVSYEWLMTGRGAKKYSLNTIPPEVKEWILKSATNITSVTPTSNAVEMAQSEQVESNKAPTGAAARMLDAKMLWDGVNRRKKNVPVTPERRKTQER